MQKSLVYSPEYVTGEDGFCTFLQKLRKLKRRFFYIKLE